MPRDDLLDAIREAYTVSPTGIVILETLEINHPKEDTIYIVKNTEEMTATLEDGFTVATFLPCPFELKMPSITDEGTAEITVAVDDIDNVPSDFIERVLSHSDDLREVQMIFRLFLSNDLTKPQNNPPLKLYWRSATINDLTVSVTAGTPNVSQNVFPNRNYTRQQFPGLAP